MKKIFKILLTIICWIVGLILLYETVASLKNMDPWGLTFTFYTLPLGIIGILLLIKAISLTKAFVKKKLN